MLSSACLFQGKAHLLRCEPQECLYLACHVISQHTSYLHSRKSCRLVVAVVLDLSLGTLLEVCMLCTCPSTPLLCVKVLLRFLTAPHLLRTLLVCRVDSCHHPALRRLSNPDSFCPLCQEPANGRMALSISKLSASCQSERCCLDSAGLFGRFVPTYLSLDLHSSGK